MSDDQDRPEVEGYGLVMPFVVCKSNGGPFDDAAFVVGMELGETAAELRALQAINGGAVLAPRYLHTSGLPQLDLIAMRYGFTCTSEGWEEDSDWSWVEFSLTDRGETE